MLIYICTIWESRHPGRLHRLSRISSALCQQPLNFGKHSDIFFAAAFRKARGLEREGQISDPAGIANHLRGADRKPAGLQNGRRVFRHPDRYGASDPSASYRNTTGSFVHFIKASQVVHFLRPCASGRLQMNLRRKIRERREQKNRTPEPLSKNFFFKINALRTRLEKSEKNA